MSDSILYWNEVALEANRISHTNGLNEETGPPRSARALAIIHLAMYDAYAATSPASGLAAYVPGLPAAPAGATASAAVAGAAHAALTRLFPGQTDVFDAKLGQAGNVLDPGHSFGADIAMRLLERRGADPSAATGDYKPKPGRGRHRPDPDNPAQGFHGPHFGRLCPLFAATQRHTLDEPPLAQTPAKKAEYIKALREVRGRGIAPELMGTVPTAISRRTIDETVIGLFWGYDGTPGLGTPPRLYNQIIRKLAMSRSPGSATTPNSEAQNARLFALVNAAMADAGALAWDDKYRHDFWRPVLGIREHDASMGPAAASGVSNLDNDTDTGWLPLGGPATNSMNPKYARTSKESYPCNHSLSGRMKNFTPPFPAYPSGHATFGAAALHVARLFYLVTPGNRKKDALLKDLDFVSEEFNGINQDNNGTVRPRHVRRFKDGLWEMIIENGRSRVFLGVHWVFDAFATDDDNKPDLNRNIGGVRLGVDIAEDIFANGMLQASAAGPRP